MIYNDRQHQVSRAELAKLRSALAATLADGNDDLNAIEADALRSQIGDIETEIMEYELLKLGQVTFSETCSLAELPRVLVRARIARGLSQTDLATQLNIKPQQVQRYEATNYMSASLARLIEVAAALDVKISESFEAAGPTSLGSIFAWNDLNDVSWSRLPFKEMAKRNWISIKPKENPIGAVRSFFTTMAGPQFATALHRKKVRSGNVPNEFALLAWQARVLGLATAFTEQRKIPSFELKDTWLADLVKLTKRRQGPVEARELLAERGIALVVERHLPGTYLDGAAMLSQSGQPVIALTLRYDRLDNFWFVLFHELGHVFLHLFDGLKFDFFDEEDGSQTDPIETQADKFALETLIPSDKWDQCLSRFAMTEEAVRIDAHTLGIDASIIAGRIRKERNNYMVFNNLVGQNSVRVQFEEIEDATD
jgi:HTH-type transcriptional regulator / antitoxin HigA